MALAEIVITNNKKGYIMDIHTLSSALYSALPEGYDTEVTSGVCLNDTIKITRANSPYTMYIGQDETAHSVLSAEVYDESDPNEKILIEPSIYWDTDDGATIETIADDITKQI